jgi:hypothetical protein
MAFVEVALHVFLTTALDSDRSQLHDPAFLPPEKIPGYHRIGILIDHRDSLIIVHKQDISCPFRQSKQNHSLAQFVA